MTAMNVPIEELPPPAGFLTSVCPGYDSLSENTHFSLDEQMHSYPGAVKAINWPLTSSSTGVTAYLQPQYLNVARPPLNPGPGLFEATTYVSLPYHVHNIFEQVILHRTQQKTADGGMQIGANFSAIVPDPFGLVHLNPGCLAQVIDVESGRRNMAGGPSDTKNPFAKLTTNFNKLLNITNAGALDSARHKLLAGAFNKDSSHFEKLIDYDPESLSKALGSPDLSKLLVAVHVNVVNVIGISNTAQYWGTSTIKTKKPLSSLLVEPSQDDQPSTKPATREYDRVVETPLLRFSLKHNYVVTSLKAFTVGGIARVVLGLNSGEIIVLNIHECSYIVIPNVVSGFDAAEYHPFTPVMSSSVTWKPVTSLEVIYHAGYDYVVIAGYANGEIAVFNPEAYEDSAPKYVKKMIDKDDLVTYFKKFDLSSYDTKPKSEPSHEWLLGHLKLSDKSITAVTSTVAIELKNSSIYNPALVAVGADDGLVRIIALNSTYTSDYGSKDRLVPRSIVSDVISNYFHDGITSVRFSPDFKFLCVAGKGDLIELFRISYYNVAALLNNNGTAQAGNAGRRSRSGTVNSVNSNGASHSTFLSPQMSSTSNSFEVPSRSEGDELGPSCAPMIKDIKIASRLKGHTNTVSKVEFVKPDQISHADLEASTAVYRLISCGFDGKIIIWEFDSKVVPKIKKPSKPKRKAPQPANKTKIINSGPISHRGPRHVRTKSNYEDQNGLLPTNLSTALSVNNMAAVLSQSNSYINLKEASGDNPKGVVALYNSLYDVRLRKHYTGLLLAKKQEADLSQIKKYSTIIHAILNDKLVPLIEIPLATLDFVTWFKDGKIDGFYLDGINFWCFGKNGDILKYYIGYDEYD